MLKVDRAQISLNVMSGLNKTEATLLQELEALGRMVAAAKEEIAAMRAELMRLIWPAPTPTVIRSLT